ncbi:MAG: NUDIX hydrolase [Bacteroides sp.]
MPYPIIFAADSQIKLLRDTPTAHLRRNSFFVHSSILGEVGIAKVLNILMEHGSNTLHARSSHLKETIIAPINGQILKHQILPNFTRIDAAGGIIVSPTGKFLFILRRQYWDLPKGKVEAGETYEQTAIREVKEETGIHEVEIVQPLISTWHLYYSPYDTLPVLKKTRWFLMRSHSEEPLTPQTEEGITEAYWLSSEDAQEVIPNAYRSVASVYEAVTQH